MAWREGTVTAPHAGLVVALDDLKAWLRIDHGEEDGLLTDLIREVAAEAEVACNIRILRQTVRVECDGWADLARLPEGPVEPDAEIAISYIAPSGDSQVLDPAVYELRSDGLEAGIHLAPGRSWPALQTGGAVTLSVAAGYAAPPYDLRIAVKQRVAQLYDRRETAPVGAFSTWDALLINYRRGC